MTTITLAQARKVVSVTGDTISVSFTTPPTLGNTLVALVSAHGNDLYNARPSNPGYPWQEVSYRSVTKVMVASFVARMDLPWSVSQSSFEVTVPGASRLTVHLYEIANPPKGFAFSAGFLQPGGVIWTEDQQPSGTSTDLAFSSFPVFAGDFDMATFVMAAFSTPLANTTTQPTITPDFGGNIGPATDGGRFASEFASVPVEDSSRSWHLAWTEAQPDGAVVLSMGQIAEKTSFSRVQRRASLTASTTLVSVPVVGNLLVASLGVSNDEIIPPQTGWNRIVGPVESDGKRICIFWREVVTGQTTAISFDAEHCFGMSVEEWSGFYGSPFVHSSALGGTGMIGTGETAGLGAMAALLPPIGLLDRITYTTIAFSGHPDGGVSLGDQYQAGIANQRVYAGGGASSINSNFYPSLGGGIWKNTTALDAFGFVVVFGDGAETVIVEAPVDPEEPEEPPTGPFVFPDEGSRLAYTAPLRRGGALTSAKGVEGYVYLDAEGDTLATITDLAGATIQGSLITVGADSKIPLFKGPGTVTTLYIRWANSTAVHPVYARSQSAPVDYGSVDLEGFAQLAGGNQFSGVQELAIDLPTLTIEEVMDGAEFSVLSSVKDDLDQMRTAVLGAKLDLSAFDLGTQTQVFDAIFESSPVTGINTGRLIIEAVSPIVSEVGDITGMRASRGILANMQIAPLFSGEGIDILNFTAAPPIVGPDVATKAYVDGTKTVPLLNQAALFGGAEFTVLSEKLALDGTRISADLMAQVDMTEFGSPGVVLTLRGHGYQEIGTDGEGTGRYLFHAVDFDSFDTNGGANFAHFLLDGLEVGKIFTEDFTFAPIQVGTPVQARHATTKAYVDSKVADAIGGPIINVMDHGAVLDGTTDDWEAIMAAIETADAESKSVYIPEGTALISTTIVVPGGVALRGAGMDRTTITRPPSVSSAIVGHVEADATTVEVENASVFAVGNPLHLWDVVHYEGDDTRRHITAINGNIITFDPPTLMDYDESGDGRASTSFALICSETDSEWGAISDLTVDQNMNDEDPKGTFQGGTIQVEFTISAIHLEQARYWKVERVRFINAFGDAYSDQGRSNLTGANHNELAWCEFIAPFRHAIHLGTSNDGSRIHHNTVREISAGYAFFFCAEVKNCVIESNYFTDCTYGLCDIDQRDSWNVITNNTFWNVGRAIKVEGLNEDPDLPFGLVIDGNTFGADGDVPDSTSLIHINLPGVVFSNNRLHNQFVRVAEFGARCVVDGNNWSGHPDYDQRPASNADWCMWIEAPDVILSNNIFEGFVSGGVQIMGGHRLVARGNRMLNSLIGNVGWVFSVADSNDCVIDGGSHQFLDSYNDPDGRAQRLVFNGLGDNGTVDPASGGPWSGLTGFGSNNRQHNGTMVRWIDGGGDTVISLFVAGVGWITLGTS